MKLNTTKSQMLFALRKEMKMSYSSVQSFIQSIFSTGLFTQRSILQILFRIVFFFCNLEIHSRLRYEFRKVKVLLHEYGVRALASILMTYGFSKITFLTRYTILSHFMNTH
jgi:hypothetical protein